MFRELWFRVVQGFIANVVLFGGHRDRTKIQLAANSKRAPNNVTSELKKNSSLIVLNTMWPIHLGKSI